MYAKSFGGGIPVSENCSIHQRFGTGVTSGTMMCPTIPYSKPASALLLMRTVIWFLWLPSIGSEESILGDPVLNTFACVSQGAVENPRFEVSQFTFSGARIRRKPPPGRSAFGLNRTVVRVLP